jgi:hypothetical protein
VKAGWNPVSTASLDAKSCQLRLQIGLSQGVVIMDTVFDCFKPEQYLHASHLLSQALKGS